MKSDKVFIKDLRVQCILGVHPWERTQTQDVLINLTLFTSTKAAAIKDELQETVDYDTLAQHTLELVQKMQRKTVEALAEDIANLCLAIKGVEKVIVRVEKPQALPFAAAAGVEITRP